MKKIVPSFRRKFPTLSKFLTDQKLNKLGELDAASVSKDLTHVPGSIAQRQVDRLPIPLRPLPGLFVAAHRADNVRTTKEGNKENRRIEAL